jgi:hypothetical protein
MQPAPHDNQLMTKHRVLGFKPQLRPEWRDQNGQRSVGEPSDGQVYSRSALPMANCRVGTESGGSRFADLPYGLSIPFVATVTNRATFRFTGDQRFPIANC